MCAMRLSTKFVQMTGNPSHNRTSQMAGYQKICGQCNRINGYLVFKGDRTTYLGVAIKGMPAYIVLSAQADQKNAEKIGESSKETRVMELQPPIKTQRTSVTCQSIVDDSAKSQVSKKGQIQASGK